MLSLHPYISGKDTRTTGNQKFVYRGPFITSVEGGVTEGGTAKIFGRNFGSVGVSVQTMTVNGVACLDAQVTVENSEIQVKLPGGAS